MSEVESSGAVDTTTSAESTENSEAAESTESIELAGETVDEQTPEEVAQELKKKLKLKVDGQEIEEEIDFNDEEKLVRYLQKAKAFDKRAQEYASFKNQVDTFFAQLQQNPEAVLEKIGLDLDSFAEQRIQRKIEELSKSPEQVAREKMEKELEDLRKEKQRLEEERQMAEMEAVKNKMAAEIESDILTALDDSNTILPKRNPEVMKRIAATMIFAIKNGYENVTVKDVIPVVEKQWKDEVQSLFNVLPEDVLENLLGKNNLERMRKKRVSSAKSTTTAKQLVKESGLKAEKNESKAKSKKSYRDFFRE